MRWCYSPRADSPRRFQHPRVRPPRSRPPRRRRRVPLPRPRRRPPPLRASYPYSTHTCTTAASRGSRIRPRRSRRFSTRSASRRRSSPALPMKARSA
ncbi:MAG: hypothetical protein E6I54_09525 [Chloroflexi bacterium]|nr:MAG: hypothetical protein E6I54_09525 [Chloroflexota bacterium]